MAVPRPAHRAIKRAALGLLHLSDRLGVQILPKHHYSAVPDYRWLRANHSLWARRADLTGLSWDLDTQLGWLGEHCRRYYHEVSGLTQYLGIEALQAGPGFGPIESQVLHCVCRSVKPRRYVEIGSGVSTLCALSAFARNSTEAAACSVTCIDPFATEALSAHRGVDLIRSEVQSMDVSFFRQLNAGDILFIDSSHAVKTGSDVNFLVLEVIPNLRPGVHVHFHDIFLPYIFRPDVLDSLWDWQETALLLALLKGNSSIAVRACLSWLHYDAPSALRALLPDYAPERRHFPTSLWLQTLT